MTRKKKPAIPVSNLRHETEEVEDETLCPRGCGHSVSDHMELEDEIGVWGFCTFEMKRGDCSCFWDDRR